MTYSLFKTLALAVYRLIGAQRADKLLEDMDTVVATLAPRALAN